jgi:CheY-like chemotaxis protein
MKASRSALIVSACVVGMPWGKPGIGRTSAGSSHNGALRQPLPPALPGPCGPCREALELLRGGLRPSSILLDLMMPVMDGWDFRQEQLADPALKDIPVVLITAAGFSRETIQAQLGDVHLLPKPVPCPALLEILGRARAQTSSAA